MQNIKVYRLFPKDLYLRSREDHGARDSYHFAHPELHKILVWDLLRESRTHCDLTLRSFEILWQDLWRIFTMIVSKSLPRSLINLYRYLLGPQIFIFDFVCFRQILKHCFINGVKFIITQSLIRS
jgi:hypothetical protein